MPNTRSTQRLRIIVLGYIVRGPLGGLAWHHLQYVMGLARLGHDVYFVEDSGDSQWCCYDPVRDVTDTDPTYGLQFAAAAFTRVGLDARWAYYDAHARRWCGPAAASAPEACATADVVVNVSGVNPLRPWLADVPCRVFVDTDPVFTRSATSQIQRHARLRRSTPRSFRSARTSAAPGVRCRPTASRGTRRVSPSCSTHGRSPHRRRTASSPR